MCFQEFGVQLCTHISFMVSTLDTEALVSNGNSQTQYSKTMVSLLTANNRPAGSPFSTEGMRHNSKNQNNRKGGTASLRSRTRVKRNVAFCARFKGLSLYFLYQNGKFIRIKTGLGTSLIRIQTRTPLWRYPPYDYSKRREKGRLLISLPLLT